MFLSLYGYLQTLSTILITIKVLNLLLELDLARIIRENINSSIGFRIRLIRYVVVASIYNQLSTSFYTVPSLSMKDALS